MVKDILEDLKSGYDDTLNGLRKELAKIRTGRANIAMLDGVRVEYYGSPTALNQIATMRVADPRLITIQPWERSLIPDIEKAIMSSDLGLNPSTDGVIVRVPIPALTGERRQELVKMARRIGEDHKIAIRNQRRDANDMLKDMQKEGDITEDDLHRGYEQVNTLTEDYTGKIDSVLKVKEEEISEV